MAEKAHKDTMLVAAAKKIGETAGKLASAAGLEGEPQARKTKGRLPKKNKARLPRRQKKAQQKAQKKAA